MKSSRLGAGLTICCLLPSVFAQSLAEPQLRGIVCIGDRTLTVLDLGGNVRVSKTSILQRGESKYGYEVRAIDEKAGRVALRELLNGREVDLKLELDPGEELPRRTLHFQSARLASVLSIYQMLSGRTVIRSFPFPNATLDLKSDAALTNPRALEILDATLASKGVLMKPRGDKFVFAVRTSEVNLLDSIPDPPPPRNGLAPEKLISPGLLKFEAVDPFQALDYYADLSGRTVLVSRNLRGGLITAANQTQLTRQETTWLMDAVFRLADVVMVPEGDKFVFAVRPSQTNDLPKFDEKTAAAKVRKSSPPGLINVQGADSKQLLDMYAAMLGRQALPIDAPLPGGNFMLHTLRPLSQAEAAFALEALARLNNCKLELVGEDKVQMLPVAAPSK